MKAIGRVTFMEDILPGVLLGSSNPTSRIALVRCNMDDIYRYFTKYDQNHI